MAFLITPSNRHLYKDVLDKSYRLRHEVFNEWLGWDIPHDNGLEKDKYDDTTAMHFVSMSREGELLGTWRMMPTTSPYMAEESFSDLFGKEEIPKRQDVWELSRFALNRDYFKGDREAVFGVAAELYVAIVEFSVAYGITELLSVQDSYITPIANERVFGESVWQGPTLPYGKTDATCYSYVPSTERIHALKAYYGLPSPCLQDFGLVGIHHAA